MRSAVLVVVVGLISFGVANATIPDETLSTVLPCDTFLGMVTAPDHVGGVLNPLSNCNFTVTAVNGQGNVIPDAFVEILFGTPGNHTFCPTAVLTGTTDDAGQLVMNIGAGGCTMGATAIRVRVNNTVIRTWQNVKSADYNGVASDGNVVLADFVYFAGRYNAHAPGCTDYFNSGFTELADFVFFAASYARTCQ
jgi:hypothetical protein